MENVLQDQGYVINVKSNLHDTFKERDSQKMEAVVEFHGFVALLTIFGAICWALKWKISRMEHPKPWKSTKDTIF